MRHLLALLLFLTATAYSAPLFPDVPDNHWAKDAVAALAAKGLVEGYPDGTFKGDRAASRWEVAMIVARLLAKMEQAHATFATRADLEQLRKLADALREELDALGVRVTVLEENVGRLDRRVTELERITFYGRLEARVVAQTFTNNGQPDNYAGLPGTIPFLNYNSLVGSAAGAPIRPQTHAVFPTVDFRNGRALTNGTGFTTLGVLGLNLNVTEEIDAGAEFAAFVSQGDQVVDAYWGIPGPYLSNVFTANQAQPQLLNQPFTRMTLDHFWLHHKPSDTHVRVGTLDKLHMDKLVYRGQPNLNVHQPAFWPGFGFRVDGKVDGLIWEAFGTRFGNGTFYAPLGLDYQNFVLGADLGYEWDDGAGLVRINWARMAEEDTGQGVGLVHAENVALGASTGWSVRQWVNPPGHFAAQRSPFEQLNTGVLPNTVDTRPIPGWNGAADNAVGVVGGGNFGPQSQNTVGASARYTFDNGLRVAAEYARSDYRPSRNSSYSAEGDALWLELFGTLFEDDLNLTLEYLSIAPDYNPAAWFGNVTGVRFPRTMNFTGVFHLHDFLKYPHNREGFRVNGLWKFDEKRGSVWARASFLDQKETSLYDVRVLPGALGAGTPNDVVIGFSPGFVDPVFIGFAHPQIYGAGTGNSFTEALAPLENPRGSENSFAVGAGYKWADPRVSVNLSYERTDFERFSSLSPRLGGSQNHVDLQSDSFHFDVSWSPDDRWTFFGGLDLVDAGGHLDPAGDYNAYAIEIDSNAFTNLDSTQTSPYVGFDHNLSDNTTWGLGARYYDTVDHVPPQVRASRALDQVGATAHPFSWDGWQFNGHFSLKF